jgi:hypothetical protein
VKFACEQKSAAGLRLCERPQQLGSAAVVVALRADQRGLKAMNRDLRFLVEIGF